MKIGELARRSGLPASTIRYYEAEGLLTPARRLANGYRDYSDKSVLELDLIQLNQKLGFPLKDIQQLLRTDKGWNHDLIQARLSERLEDTRRLIGVLQAQAQEITGLQALLGKYWEKNQCVPDEEMTRLLKSALSFRDD